MWYGRSSRPWRKALASHRGNFGNKELLQLDAVAHLAEARIGRDPGVRARDPDHMKIGAAAEAQPLHDLDVGARARILGGSHHLMPRLSADPQRLRRVDMNVSYVGNAAEHIACERVAVGRLSWAAGSDRDHEMSIDLRPGIIRRRVGEHDGAPRDHA